jgi:ribonucleoside-diphosphate reductase alpha chain
LPDSVFQSSFAESIYTQRYRKKGEDWTPDAGGTPSRVVRPVMDAIGMGSSPEADRLIQFLFERKWFPGGRYLANAGTDHKQVQNCLLMRAEDSRQGWADLVHKQLMGLLGSAGTGTVYDAIRPAGALIRSNQTAAPGPLPLMHAVNEGGRGSRAGGGRRAAMWAGLSWWHADIFKFIELKNWNEQVVDTTEQGEKITVGMLKEADFEYPAPMDMTNISVILDRNFFDVFEGKATTAPVWDDETAQYVDSDVAPDGGDWQAWALEVYSQTLRAMLTTAEPGFSVNYNNAMENLRNACTEVVSVDDSDICNLGSVVLSRIDDKEELAEVTRLVTLFLIAGTFYSDVPYEKVAEVREKNRRLGLGHMGGHEWLLKRGKRYGPDDELGEWMDVWERESDAAADYWADVLGINRPLGVRAIAPNGTIGILAETTTSAEPMFAAAYKRRIYNNGDPGNTKTEYEYVVDPVAARLVAEGVDPSLIEDSASLAYDPERRIAFQAWLQQWVDQSISSTINLPAKENQVFSTEEFGGILYKYLPQLRGITCYPDGARGGQPLTPWPLEDALAKQGVRFEEHEEACVGGLCGV